jgi:CBS domain containing-hemolysin-like protein
MIPREEIFAMDLAVPRKEFVERVLSSGYSRVPVYRGTLDKIEGIVYSKDLLTYWRSEALIVLEDTIRPVLRIPVDTSLGHIMRVFRQGHHHMALVTDKSHRVQGLLTLQDALEAIVGETAEEADLHAARGRAAKKL